MLRHFSLHYQPIELAYKAIHYETDNLQHDLAFFSALREQAEGQVLLCCVLFFNIHK